jgi:hypothetical protein
MKHQSEGNMMNEALVLRHIGGIRDERVTTCDASISRTPLESRRWRSESL